MVFIKISEVGTSFIAMSEYMIVMDYDTHLYSKPRLFQDTKLVKSYNMRSCVNNIIGLKPSLLDSKIQQSTG